MSKSECSRNFVCLRHQEVTNDPSSGYYWPSVGDIDGTSHLTTIRGSRCDGTSTYLVGQQFYTRPLVW